MNPEESLLLPLPEPVEVVHLDRVQHRRFQPLKPYICYRMDPSLPIKILRSYTRQAQHTNTFTMHLLRTRPDHLDEITHMVIELMETNTSMATVFVFVFTSLPGTRHRAYGTFRRLIRAIFHPSKRIITWTDEYFNLSRLFQLDYLYQQPHRRLTFIRIHDYFKAWYQNNVPHQSTCYSVLVQVPSSRFCSCRHRLLTSFQYQWNIPQAIESAFNEVLPQQSNTPRLEALVSGGTDTSISIIDSCLAITKLWTTIRSYIFL